MKLLTILVLILFIGGCGISSFKCYIETDEELLKRVLKENDYETKKDESKRVREVL